MPQNPNHEPSYRARLSDIFHPLWLRHISYGVSHGLDLSQLNPYVDRRWSTHHLHHRIGHPGWIGYQALIGLGIGMGMLQPSMAAQTTLLKKDVPIGVALVTFNQALGGAIFLSVGQVVFVNGLIGGLANIPGLDAAKIVNAGATDLRGIVGSSYLPNILTAYNHALTNVFKLATAVACISIVGALAMEWKSVKKGEAKGPAATNAGAPVDIEAVVEKGEKETNSATEARAPIDVEATRDKAVNPEMSRG